MRENLNFLTLLRKLQHPLAPIIVDLKGVNKWVIKAHTCSAVDDDISFASDHRTVLCTESELINDKVTSDWYNFLSDELFDVWVIFE